MNATNFWIRTTLIVFALLAGLPGSTADPVSADPGSQDRLRPYSVAGMAAGEGQILSHTLDSANPEAGAYFGHSVSLGDVNEDGNADIVVGAWLETVDGHGGHGRAYVFSGADGSLLYTLTISDEWYSRPHVGYSSAVGDVNGDGYGDIVVGAEGLDDHYYLDYGGVFVFSGADGSLLFSMIPPCWNNMDGTYFGDSVAVGDLNGGRPEIVVGAPWKHGSSRNFQGAVYVYSSSGSLLFSLNPTDPQSNAHFGDSVAAGDVNGDGHDEIVVGAPGQTRTYVFSGGGALLSTLNAGGSSVAVGDVNGDGIGDIATSRFGQTDVFSGVDGSLLYTGPYGDSVAVDDMDGDGKADVIVGSPDEERTYVFSGADGLTLYTVDSPNPQGGSDFGYGVAAGDVDGDAEGDLVVGARFEDVGGNSNQGRAYVFSGTAAGHILRAPCCDLPVSLTNDNAVLSSDLGAGPALSIADAQVHDRWSWRYYDPSGDPWADEDGCFMEIREPGEEGNDSPYDALVTNCPTYSGDDWDVLETFPDGCPCTPENVWTLAMLIAGHWSASQSGTWTSYIDYTDPEGTVTQGIVQEDMTMTAQVPAVMLVHGWESDCPGGMDEIRQNLQKELGIPPERLDCYDYDSREGIEDPAQGLGRRIREFRQTLGLGPDEEVDIVAHSQGGLVARYYQQFEWTSADGPIGSISMLGTPNDGVRIAKLKDWLCTAALVLLPPPLDALACPIGRWLVLEIGDIDFASQAVTDMTPKSKILLKMNEGFTLPELPVYEAHAGTRSTDAGTFISGDSTNDCAIGLSSVGGPNNLFSLAAGTLKEHDLTHAAVSFIPGCEEPTLNASHEIARDVAATIKGAPPEAGLGSAEGNIAAQTEAEELGGAEPIISSVFDYVTPSGSKNHTISVPSGLEKGMFVVYWLDSNALEPNLGVTLRRPSGQVVNPSDPDVIQQGEVTGDGMFYVLFTGFIMSAPQAGDWQITVDGLATPEEGQAYLAALIPMGSQVALGASTADPSLQEGQPELITAAMFDNAAPIAVTTISAKVDTPAGTEQVVALLDDGAGGDEAAGDHIYSGTFASTTECGLYGVTVNATAASSEGSATRQQFVSFHTQVPGDAIRDPCNPDEDEDGLADFDELNVVHTDPLAPDTDADGMPDGYEHTYTCLNPLINDAAADPDGDGQNNLVEYGASTNPCSASGAVGGIAEAPDMAATLDGNGSSGTGVFAIAGMAAAVALALAAGGRYVRKRRRAG